MCLWQPSLGSVANTQLCSMPKFPVSLKPSARTVEARDSVREIFNSRPALTLERGIGRFADDTEIWQKGPFRAGITPDLPAVSSWKELGARLLGRLQTNVFLATSAVTPTQNDRSYCFSCVHSDRSVVNGNSRCHAFTQLCHKACNPSSAGNLLHRKC